MLLRRISADLGGAKVLVIPEGVGLCQVGRPFFWLGREV
jgi:hypothetical protein